MIDRMLAVLSACTARALFAAYLVASGGSTDPTAPPSSRAQEGSASAGKAAPGVASTSVATQSIELSAHEFSTGRLSVSLYKYRTEEDPPTARMSPLQIPPWSYMSFKPALLLVAVSLATSLDQLAAAEAGAVNLRTSDARVICTASDSYCKVTVRVMYSYPAESRPAVTAVPIECVAWFAIRQGIDNRETVQSFQRVLYTPVRYGAIDNEVDVVLKPPVDARSMQLKSVSCTISS